MAVKEPMEPVVVVGRSIVNSWWGKAWNRNLESYADLSNRISRGRSYFRQGAVIDLKISPGLVSALVSGSRVKPYKVTIDVDPMSPSVSRDIQSRCSEKLSDVEALFEGRMPLNMENVLTSSDGLFPRESEIHFHCSCPDSAYMCKHVVAVLYGLGVRFDSDPKLFFELRRIPMDMLVETTMRNRLDLMLQNADKATSRMLDESMIGSLFGVVENKEHERSEPVRDTLIGMMGRSAYDEGSVLVRSGAVSVPEDMGDGLVKVLIKEKGSNPYRVVIWKDRHDGHLKSECDCDSEGMCRHIAASLISVFSPKDELQRDEEMDREYRRLAEAVEHFQYDIEDILIEDSDDYYDDYDDRPSVEMFEYEAMELVAGVLDDVFDTLGEDVRAIYLYDDIYRVCSGLCDGVDKVLEDRLPDMNTAITEVDKDILLKLIGCDFDSWLFHFISDIPGEVLEEAYAEFKDDTNWNINQMELAYHLGMYEGYIDHSREVDRVDAVLRCARSAIALHRDEDAVRYAEMLRDDEIVPYHLTKDVNDLLRELKLDDKMASMAKIQFIQDPSSKTFRELTKVSGDVDTIDIMREAFEESSKRRNLNPDNLTFFIDNGMLEEVTCYLDGDTVMKMLRGCMNYDKMLWLFTILEFNEKYESSALLARCVIRHILDKDRRQYASAARLLHAMDSKSGYESLAMPHSEYMKSLKKTDGRKVNLWDLYKNM